MTDAAIQWPAVLTVPEGALDEPRHLPGETVRTAGATERGQLVSAWH